MKELIIWFLTVAINPSVTLKKWTVDCGNFYGGHFKSFWFKKNAIKYAGTQNAIFVTLINEIYNTRTRLIDNPDGIEPPSRPLPEGRNQ